MAKCLRNYDQKDQIDLGEFWVLDKYKVYLLMTNNSIRKKIHSLNILHQIKYEFHLMIFANFPFIFAPNQDFSCVT